MIVTTFVPTVSGTPLIIPSSLDIKSHAGQPAAAWVNVRSVGFKSINS